METGEWHHRLSTPQQAEPEDAKNGQQEKVDMILFWCKISCGGWLVFVVGWRDAVVKKKRMN